MQWHLGIKAPSYLPSHRGFDRYYGYYNGVMDYWTHAQTAHLDPEQPPPAKPCNSPSDCAVVNGGLDLHQGGADFGTAGQLDAAIYNSSGRYSSQLFANKSAEWIAEHGKKRPSVPMFLYLAFQGCHSGDNSFVQAPQGRIDQFEVISPASTCGSWDGTNRGECTLPAMRKSVAATASAVDDGIGTVVAALKAARMWQDTLFVLSTDNGGENIKKIGSLWTAAHCPRVTCPQYSGASRLTSSPRQAPPWAPTAIT